MNGYRHTLTTADEATSMQWTDAQWQAVNYITYAGSTSKNVRSIQWTTIPARHVKITAGSDGILVTLYLASSAEQTNVYNKVVGPSTGTVIIDTGNYPKADVYAIVLWRKSGKVTTAQAKATTAEVIWSNRKEALL